MCRRLESMPAGILFPHSSWRRIGQCHADILACTWHVIRHNILQLKFNGWRISRIQIRCWHRISHAESCRQHWSSSVAVSRHAKTSASQFLAPDNFMEFLFMIAQTRTRYLSWFCLDEYCSMAWPLRTVATRPCTGRWWPSTKILCGWQNLKITGKFLIHHGGGCLEYSRRYRHPRSMSDAVH